MKRKIAFGLFFSLVLICLNLPTAVIAGCYYQDADGDGYGDPNVKACGAQPAGYVADKTDCDDTNAAVNPGAVEICGDGIDNDCTGGDAVCLNTWYLDADGDTYGDAAVSTQAASAPAGYVADNTDCDDSNPAVNPGAAEVCGDGLDNDCVGGDAACATWYPDIDNDGYGDASAGPTTAATQPAGYVSDNTDCDDGNGSVHPGAAEICGNGIDEDCDGTDLACSGGAVPNTNMIDWNGNLVADFGANGIWYHDGADWVWLSNEGNVGPMVVWNNHLVVDFGADKGLYYYDGTWNWLTNMGGANELIAWNNGTVDVLVADFGAGRRIYMYDGAAWNWLNNKDDVAGMSVWNNKLIVDFGAGRGVYNYDGAWHWMSNKDDVNGMLIWDDGSLERLVVDFGAGRRVYTYDGTWAWLVNKDDTNNMTVWNRKLVVDFGVGRCLYAYDGAWNWLTNKDNTTKLTDWSDGASEKLAVAFGAGRGIYYYDGTWNWMRNDDNVPEMLAWGNRLAVDFGSGIGVYNYDGTWIPMKSWSTAD